MVYAEFVPSVQLPSLLCQVYVDMETKIRMKGGWNQKTTKKYGEWISYWEILTIV